MIVQNVSRRKMTDISFTVDENKLKKTISKTKEISEKIGAGRVISNKNIAKISVVGIGMRSHSGVAARCFSVLAKNKINIDMISTSEISISCLVKKESGKKALRILHKEFKLDKKKKRGKR
jgi:aspartate kinase